MSANIIAIMPMKAHSERVPGKNVKILGDKPLFFHIADMLRTIDRIERLVINTDCAKIAHLAQSRYSDWVEISYRPEELCGDFVSMNEILAYEVDRLNHDGVFFQVHSTSPFLQADTVNNAIDYFLAALNLKNLDSVFSVNRLHSRLYDRNINPINHDPAVLIRTQDLDPIFEENSTFYCFTEDSFKKTNTRIGLTPGVYPVSRLEALDIDFMDDWIFAEKLIKKGENSVEKFYKKTY